MGYIFLPFLTALTSFLPEDIWSFTGKIMGYVFYIFLRDMRSKIKKNLKCIKGDYKRIEIIATFVNFFTSLLYYAGIRTLGLKKLKKKVIIEARDEDRKILLEKGGIVLSGHIGNPDIGSILFSMGRIKGYELVEDIKIVSEVLKSYRERASIKTIPLSRLKKLFKLKEKKVILYLLIDRDITGTGEVEKFLKCKRRLPRGFYKIIEKFNKSVFIAYCILKREKVPYYIKIKKLKDMTNIIPEIEEIIRENPYFWFAFDDSWA